MQRVAGSRQGLDRLKGFVERLGYGPDRLCPICFVIYGEAQANHEYSGCKKNEGLEWGDATRFNLEIKWPANFGICWSCGLPEEICEKARAKTKEERARALCSNKWVLVPIVMCAQVVSSIAKRTLEMAKEEDFSRFNYAEWLGSQHEKRLYGVRATNALAVLDMVVSIMDDK